MPQRGTKRKRVKPIESLSASELYLQLSPKQRALAYTVSNGNAKVDAYKEIYDSTTKRPEGLRREAFEVADGNVMAAAGMLSKAYLAKELRSPVETRAFVLAGLHQMAASENETPTKLRALELVGKLPAVDLWEERGKALERAPSAVVEDLEARLSMLLEGLSAADTVVDLSCDGPDIGQGKADTQATPGNADGAIGDPTLPGPPAVE